MHSSKSSQDPEAALGIHTTTSRMHAQVAAVGDSRRADPAAPCPPTQPNPVRRKMGGGTAATVAAPSSSQASAAATLPSTPPASSTSSEASGSEKPAAQHGTPPPAGLVEPKRAASASQQSQSDAAAPSAAAAACQERGAAAPPQDKAGEAAVPMVLSSSMDDDDLYRQPQQGQQQPEPPTKPPAQGPCRFDGCGKESPYRCMQCGDAFYCSRAHQRVDWTRRLPDGTKGGHHTECVPRQWLPAVPAEAVPYLPPFPPPPPRQQQDGGETIWSCSGGELGGNAAKRLRVGDDLLSGGGGGGGGGEDKSNPQGSMWSSSGAESSAMLTPAYWREGGSGPGPGTQPLGGLVGSGGGSSTSLVPIAPMAGYDEEYRDLPPAIHPAGFEVDGVGMAAGEEGRVVAGASAIIDLAGEDPPPMMTAGPPPEDALMQLMEMGFEEGEVRSALLVKANDVQRACEYLLGGSGAGGGGGAIEAAGSMDFDSTAAEQAAVELVGISGGGWSTPRVP